MKKRIVEKYERRKGREVGRGKLLNKEPKMMRENVYTEETRGEKR